jgi:hypothetical protein
MGHCACCPMSNFARVTIGYDRTFSVGCQDCKPRCPDPLGYFVRSKRWLSTKVISPLWGVASIDTTRTLPRSDSLQPQSACTRLPSGTLAQARVLSHKLGYSRTSSGTLAQARVLLHKLDDSIHRRQKSIEISAVFRPIAWSGRS